MTSTTCHAGCNFNYVMTADSRIDGPYKDTDYEEPPPLTRQLKHFMTREFHPWQKQIFDTIQELDDCSIKLIINLTATLASRSSASISSIQTRL